MPIDKHLQEALREAYGIGSGIRTRRVNINDNWRYCTNCCTMRSHKEEKIAGIIDFVCTVCDTAPLPQIKQVFKLTKRPK